MRIADSSEHDVISRFVASAQSDPERHIAYVGDEPDTILLEFARAENWADRLAVAVDHASITGVLLADVDPDMRRVWWVGPWAGDIDTMTALMNAVTGVLGDAFDTEELAPDGRNTAVASFGRACGFSEGTGSLVLYRRLTSTLQRDTTTVMAAHQAAQVATLHDRLFPGTHARGTTVVADPDTTVRCAIRDGSLAGYLAYQIQLDGTGYIDYLGVEPDARRRGIARALIADACAAMAAARVPEVHLTVRLDADGARELYRSVGFTETRVIQPLRKGFTLG